jgi:hypothetical protein
MSSKIQNLLQSALGDGARTAKFSIILPPPSSSSGTPPVKMDEMNVICKAASFPGKSLETIPFLYKGRTIPLPGQHKYSQTWELSFYLEEDHKTRLYFMDWMQAMNDINESHYIGLTSGQTAEMRKTPLRGRMTTLKVNQLDFDMRNTKATYTLYNCFPTNISDITVDSSQVGSVAEYTVTFSFSHFIIQGGLKEHYDI